MEYVIPNGTKAEVNKYFKFFMDYVKADSFPDMLDKDFNRLFCEALGRNIVVAELTDMMNYIWENEDAK